MDKDLKAIQSAIFHYQSEVKNKKSYAVPILKGLIIAQQKLEKYNSLVKLICINENSEG